MKTSAPLVVSVCLALGIAGCFGGSSSSGGSSGSNNELPENFDGPGDDGVVEEVEEGGTQADEPFEGRRFFVEGDTDSEDHLTPGLWAWAEESEIIDKDALPERQFVTIPWIDDSDGTQKLATYGVFYRTASDFRFAFTTGEVGTQTIASNAEAGGSCLGPVAFSSMNPDQTALTYAQLRDDDGNCTLDAETQWHWLAIGADEGPNVFESGVPRVGLPAVEDKAPSWLVRNAGEGDELKRVFAEINGAEPISIKDGEGESVTLDQLSLVAELGLESFLVAKQKPGLPIRLAHFDAANDTLTTLVSEQFDSIPAFPQPDRVTVRKGVAYFALQNLLLRADAEGVSIVDGVTATIDGTEVQSRPLFVMATDTHSLWGVRTEIDENIFRQVRVVEHGSEEGGTFLAAGGYVDAQVRGHANGWMYFTVAEGAQANGRLDSPVAIGINPSEKKFFILEKAHWIGSTLDAEAIDSFSDLATAPIKGLFFRAGDDLTRIAALIDPAQPLAEEATEDGGTRTTLPIVTIDTLESGFTAVSMGPGFGPDRLLTAIRVDDVEVEDGESVDPGTDRVISSRVFRVDPRETQAGLKPKSEEGSLVRALRLY